MTTDVTDLPAERGIHMINFLLAVLIAFGGVFGTTMTMFQSDLKQSVEEVNITLGVLSVTNGVALNDIAHLKKASEGHSLAITEINRRMRELERGNKL